MIERRPATYSFNLPSKVAADCNEIDNKLLAYAKHGSSIIYLCDAYARLADTHCRNKQSKKHELAHAWTIASSNIKTRTFRDFFYFFSLPPSSFLFTGLKLSLRLIIIHCLYHSLMTALLKCGT